MPLVAAIRKAEPGVPLSKSSLIRVAPSVGNIQAAHQWRFWIEKDEIYATNRMPRAHEVKFSFHFSGKSHMHQGVGQRQDLPPPLRLDEIWTHLLEVRFLLSRDALRPPQEDLKQGAKAYLFPVPDDHFLILNLFRGVGPTADIPRPPLGFGRVCLLWAYKLRSGHPVILIGRSLRMDTDNQAHIDRIRQGIRPKRAGDDPRALRLHYTEVRNAIWGPGGNIALVVPMGTEGAIVPSYGSGCSVA